MQLCTVGYGRWAPGERTARLLRVLQEAHVTTLVDIRHAPCSSQLSPDSTYGPRDWHLQTAGQGLSAQVARVGISYRWLGELGNPQKNDPAMTILRAHLASADDQWPVNRGLRLLAQLLHDRDQVCCLLCACKDYDGCHRKLIAEALTTRFFAGQLTCWDLR